MNTAIETNGLTKVFGDVTAVEHLSLRVAKGEIYAFLGLNGAGKTTTIRMLLGMIEPTAGEAYVLGTGIRHGQRKPWSSVGYLVETADSYPELTVRENLEAIKRLRPGTPSQAIEDAIERLGLHPYTERRAGTLSHGNKQRLGLARAMLHHPQLLILDEPATGLDPAGIVEIRNLLTELVREEGVTVFMSSHILAEVSRLADRIGILHRGRLVRELGMDDLEGERQRRLLIRAKDIQAAGAVLAAVGISATLAPDGMIEARDPFAIEHPEEIATRLVNAGHAPTLLMVDEEDLEHYFLRLIGMEEGTAG
jgi:ABC-2 type transport system ATP-binding protein